MNDGTFTKIEKSDRLLHGAPALLICGYPAKEHKMVLGALESLKLDDRPVIFAVSADLRQTLKRLLQSEHRAGIGQPSEMSRAMIMSGFSQAEIHRLMTAYRQGGMPPQLWATLTPTSENWTLEDLLAELAAEAQAIRKRQAQQRKASEKDEPQDTPGS